MNLTISWWVLRHRLHHRFTDTDSDPYSATKGLFFCHIGWILKKQRYPLLRVIDKGDLDRDAVVRIQHQYFISLAIFSGFLLPTLAGYLWLKDALKGFLWGGIIARILIWHSTFAPLLQEVKEKLLHKFSGTLYWRPTVYNTS